MKLVHQLQYYLEYRIDNCIYHFSSYQKCNMKNIFFEFNNLFLIKIVQCENMRVLFSKNVIKITLSMEISEVKLRFDVKNIFADSCRFPSIIQITYFQNSRPLSHVIFIASQICFL